MLNVFCADICIETRYMALKNDCSLCAAPTSVPHLAVKEAEVRGYTIPANTIALAYINGIHHDPAVWPDPYLFNPDRFLDKGGHFCPPKENFVPFSIGERPNSKHRFTTPFLQPLPYLVTSQVPGNYQLMSSFSLVLKQ